MAYLSESIYQKVWYTYFLYYDNDITNDTEQGTGHDLNL